MKNPKKHYILSMIAFAVLVLFTVTAVYVAGRKAIEYYGYATRSTTPTIGSRPESGNEPDGNETASQGSNSSKAAQSAPTTSIPTQTYQQAPKVQATPQAQQKPPQTPTPTSPLPYTNTEIIIGVPEITAQVGIKCPLYDIVMQPGCDPQIDIRCNSDWTICKYLGK